jgi:hypothetical protein
MKHPLKAFCKAVLMGTLAGGLLPMSLTLPIAIEDYLEPISGERRLFADIYFAGLPLWISFAVVLVSGIVVGIPVHLILQKLDAGSRQLYISIGAGGGLAVTAAGLVAIGAVAGFWMVFLGAFSGAMTALSWTNSLESSLAVEER